LGGTARGRRQLQVRVRLLRGGGAALDSGSEATAAAARREAVGALRAGAPAAALLPHAPHAVRLNAAAMASQAAAAAAAVRGSGSSVCAAAAATTVGPPTSAALLAGMRARQFAPPAGGSGAGSRA